MARSQKILKTIWRIPDELWHQLKSILDEHDPPSPVGRKRIDAGAALDAMIFRLGSGCQWNQLPNAFPDHSSVDRTFQRWERFSILERIWSALVEECEELGGVDWCWHAAQPWQKLVLAVMKLVQIRLSEPNPAPSVVS